MAWRWKRLADYRQLPNATAPWLYRVKIILPRRHCSDWPKPGKFTGTRVHRPITIVEELDRITPLLYRAVCEGRTLKKATIKMYRILESASRPSISISFWKTSNSQPWRLIWRLAVCVVRILKRLNYAMRRLPGSIQTVILSIAIHGAIAAVPDNFLHHKS